MRLERERDLLEREVTSLRMAVQQMKRDNSQLKQNITQLGSFKNFQVIVNPRVVYHARPSIPMQVF